MTTKQSLSQIRWVLRRLDHVFGPVEPPEQLPVLDELVATILSQNTTDSNSGAAFEELKRRFRDWNDVRRASVERIAEAIRVAGLPIGRLRGLRRFCSGCMTSVWSCRWSSCMTGRSMQRAITCGGFRESGRRRRRACCCSRVASRFSQWTLTFIESANDLA